MVVPFLESPPSLCARIGTHEPLRVRSAGFRACGFGRLSSRPFMVHRTRKSGEPAGWKDCATSRFMECFRGSRARIGTVNCSCRRKEADIEVNTGNPPLYVGDYESTVHEKQHWCVLFVKVRIGGYQSACFCHCKFDGCRRPLNLLYAFFG